MEYRPSSDQICRVFSVNEIRSVTQNFNEDLVIGCGGFGKVYKATIIDGSTTVVAIKRLHSKSNQGAAEFRAEVEMLSKLRHCNLVSMIGYCEDGKEMVLVYEYMPNGTLEDGLHKDGAPLSWLRRLKICLGAARGLDYLHTGTGTQHGVIHRDVKSSNILLDNDFAAKISDFGLAKTNPINLTHSHVSTGVKGTFGYMDPCYFYSGKLTRRSDVYSFGVVLLEVICGRPAVDTSLDEEQWGLAPWAQDRIKKGKLVEIIDSRLKGQVSSNNLKDVARLACRCLHNIPNKRPTMAQIIASLESIVSKQERVDSSVTEVKLIDKVWSIFSGKVQLKSGQGSSGGEPSDKAAGTSKVDLGRNAVPGYTYEDLLGEGSKLISMSSYWKTYRATLTNGNQLLVRQMKKGLVWKEDVLASYRSLEKLCHRHILAPKPYAYSKGDIFYITDYINTTSLSSYIRRESKIYLFWAGKLSIMIAIAKALVYLHTEKNIVHGYLTSKKVLLVEAYKPFIADVGLSQLINDGEPNSPQDHAPELMKFQDANKKTDMYSLGLIMLELLSRKSVEGFDLPGCVRAIPREKWRSVVFDPELMLEYPHIKQELVRVLELAMACVSLSPNARPNAQEVLQQLEEI